MNIKDIARLAGVSTSTVSKIINGKDEHISSSTKEKVLNVVNEYNYTPYEKIRYNTGSKSFIIALITDIAKEEPLFISCLSSQLEKDGYHLLICDISGSPVAEKKDISYVCIRGVDAVIWRPFTDDIYDGINAFKSSNIPYILLGDTTADSLDIDYKGLSYDSVLYLASKGHSKILLVSAPSSKHRAKIEAGYKTGLLDNGFSFFQDDISQLSNAGLLDYIKSHGITALLFDDYKRAIEMYHFFTSYGYSIPSYLSMLSMSNVPDPFLLSTVLIPWKCFAENLAAKAVSLCRNDKDSFRYTPYSYDILDLSIDEPHTLRDEKVVVLGSINIDTVLNIQNFPAPGVSSHTTSYSITPGGKGANHAVGVSKLHHNVSILGKIGYDMESDMIYSTLNENHVDLTSLYRDKAYTPGKAFIYLKPNGASSRSILDGANASIDKDYVNTVKKTFNNCRYLIVSTEVPLDAVNTALRIAKKKNSKVILKPVHLKSLDDILLDHIDVLVPNSVEAEILTNGVKDPREQCLSLHKKSGISYIIITSWEKGCILYTPSGFTTYPPVDFEIIDSTGGSDAFVSALTSYLLYGYPIEKAAAIANYAAGFCISRQGVIPALIDKNSLEIYINRVEPELLIK